jgi:transcription initiation factor TFIIB
LVKEKNWQKIDYVKKCPECNSKNLKKDYHRAEIVCGYCGLVVQENLIDQGPEWRAFDNEQKQKRARTGPPIKYTLHDKGLSTTLSWQNRDAYGRPVPTKNRAQIFRLRKWQRRTHIANASERSLAIGFAELSRISSAMGLTRSVREQAGMLYKKAANKNLIRGRSANVIVTATIYAACRLNNIPRTLDEISKASGFSRKEIGRTYRFISRELGLKMSPTSPIDYVSRFCNELKLSQDVKTKTIEILKDGADKELISGRGPTGIAAAVIYIATVLCSERKTQKEIADVAGVTEVTVRNRYKELAERLDIALEL